MSNRLLNLAWSAEGLSPVEKLILLNLADRANAQNEAFPGHRLIASETGLSERTVRDKLPEIAAKGHLTIRSEGHRASKDKSLFTYLVHPKAPARASRVREEPVSAVTRENGAADTGGPASPHRKNGAATAENGARPYITSLNQSNPQGNRSPAIRPKFPSEIKAQIDAVSERRNELKNRHYSEAIQRWDDQAARQEYKALSERRKELEKQLIEAE